MVAAPEVVSTPQQSEVVEPTQTGSPSEVAQQAPEPEPTEPKKPAVGTVIDLKAIKELDKKPEILTGKAAREAAKNPPKYASAQPTPAPVPETPVVTPAEAVADPAPIETVKDLSP